MVSPSSNVLRIFPPHNKIISYETKCLPMYFEIPILILPAPPHDDDDHQSTMMSNEMPSPNVNVKNNDDNHHPPHRNDDNTNINTAAAVSAPNAFHQIVNSPCEYGLTCHPSDENHNPIEHFFRHIWQIQPAIYRKVARKLEIEEEEDEEETSPSSSSSSSSSSALTQTIQMTWNDVADLFHHSLSTSSTSASTQTSASTSTPLAFHDGRPLHSPHPHSDYLSGHSLVLNHADSHHPRLSRLCLSLRETFPHAYANVYLTPPEGRAADPHADDRDVLLVQVQGKKKWRVCETVPVKFPFEEEQVGKGGREVPVEVWEGTSCFGGGKEGVVVLEEGDVLYLPRGFVHGASTAGVVGDEPCPSFHVTVALATQDWCMAAVVAERVRDVLNGVEEFRMALPIGPCGEYEKSGGDGSGGGGGAFVEESLARALDVIRERVTGASVERRLRWKYSVHNARADVHRRAVVEDYNAAAAAAAANRRRAPSKKRKINATKDDRDDEENVNAKASCEPIVGPNAASRVRLETFVRASTPSERESILMEEGRLRGLTVREETHGALMAILAGIKNDPRRAFCVGSDLRGLAKKNGDGSGVGDDDDDDDDGNGGLALVCDFTLLSFVRCCVELGALAVVVDS
ncbi:hypothetical protein ACHAXS_014254 [Conticribra weissflogii]